MVRAIAVAAIAACALAMPAAADEAAPSGDDWSFMLSPYVWAAGLEGEVGLGERLPPADVDVGFKDILRNLDLAAMVLGEVRYRKFSAYADIVYTKISGDTETPAQILFDDIEAENTIFIGTFGGGYRAVEGERGFLDLLAGARVWSVDTALDLDGGILDDRHFNDDQDWVDPVIGIKGRVNLGAGFYLNGLAHVGGFGAASDLTWDVFGGLAYQFNDTVSAIAGYRHLEVDYDRNGFKFDVELSGPVIGATIRF